MMETHDPMRDNIFKVIFQNHPDSLRHLLNSFLPLPHPIDSIVFLSNELHDFFADGRVGIVDVRCRDTQGRTFIVEMQIRKTPLLLQRLIWNAARILARQPVKGGPFKALQPVYTLCLLEQTLVTNTDDWIHHYALRSDGTDAPPENILHITIVELRKWRNSGTFEKADPRHGWMCYFTKPESMKELYTPEEQEKLQEMFEVVNAWDLTRYTEVELSWLERKVDYMFTAQTIHEISLEEGRQLGLQEGKELGLQEGKELGLQEGKELGLQEGKQLAVNEMLWLLAHIQSNPDIRDAELQRISGLSVEAIQALRAMVQRPGSEG
jgi:predicted transposase/invertase (TIGR01784 family)